MENKAQKPRILILTPGILPVPAVRGGAVEKLVTDIIGENETVKTAEITVVTIADNGIASDGYSMTKIVQVSRSHVCEFTDRAIDKLLRTVKAKKSVRLFDRNLIKGLEAEADLSGFDVIVVENMMVLAEALVKETAIKGSRARVFVHVHNKIDMYRPPASIKDLSENGVEFITVSEYLKNEILKVAPDARVSVLYNGIDKSLPDIRLKEKKQELREKYKIPCDKTVLLYTGRIIAEKGVYELVRSFVLHKQANPGSRAVLVLAGSGIRGEGQQTEYERRVYSEIDKAGDSIVVLGQIPYKDIFEVYAAADVLVVPTLVDEAFGMVVLEGMAMGLPIITTATGGVPEVLEDEAGCIKVSRDNLCEDLVKAFERVCSGQNHKELEEMGTHNLNTYRSKDGIDKANYYDSFLSVVGISGR